ncbi:MAG TPA: flavin reductase family protein [Rhodothermales bacterium]|nr:flavin reductase [Bacteroidota bacterium]HRK72697.1 flavin reductase family protein [Rhodothermales bacterium]HRR08147.1 flavin reductase family protein [Rhodothermales bacterium]
MSTHTTPGDTIDGEQLRLMMRSVPSPVVVVTAVHDQDAWGITLGSFTSVSLDPPLISFNVARQSRMHDILALTKQYAVHILSSEDVPLSNRFSDPTRSADTQFEGLLYEASSDGLPLLQGTIGVLLCKPFARHDAGDHSLFIGQVTGTQQPQPHKIPLLYYNRSYRTIGESVIGS